MVWFSAQAYSYPKDLSRPIEWEDCAACSVRTGRFAVADGAAASFGAGEWAQYLVSAYAAAFPAPTAIPTLLGPTGKERLHVVRRWFAGQAGQWQEQQQAAPPGSWWEEDAARQSPAAATFAGLSLVPAAASAYWEASAVGDSCLLHISGRELTLSFPLSDASQFGRQPDLLTAAPDRLEGSLSKLRVWTGQAVPGDVFVLATDAASRMLLQAQACDSRLLGRMGFIGATEFLKLVEELRSSKAIEVDDVAMVVVVVHP